MALVEFTGTFILHRGAQLNKGDRAQLTDTEAGIAIRFGVGMLIQDDKGYEYDGRKALVRPPMDKQLKVPPSTK